MAFTPQEVINMTSLDYEDLDNEQLESLGANLDHYVSWTVTISEPDEVWGILKCQCGWEKEARSNWTRDHVIEHLKGVIDAYPCS